MTRLYHISDQPAITLFEPREPPSGAGGKPVVWAIDAEHLPNYLLPRDCPRVTFYAREDSAPADIERLLCGTTATRVIAIEAAWLPKLRDERLYRYELDPAGFSPADEIAGYYTCAAAVAPISEAPIDDILGELARHDVELRVMPSLWKLREAVIHSTLGFSLIRMRNAQPPAEGYEAYHPLPSQSA